MAVVLHAAQLEPWDVIADDEAEQQPWRESADDTDHRETPDGFCLSEHAGYALSDCLVE